MRTAWLLLPALASGILTAQVKLYTVVDPATGAEREVTGSLLEVGSAGAGDTILTRFRLRNIGVTTQQIQTIRIAGQGFTLSIPPLPYTLAPNGAPLDFTVRFSGTGSGSYSASLTAGTISVLLRANVTAGVTVSVEASGGTRTVLAAGTPVPFGNIQRGQTARRSFWLENRNSVPLTVQSLQVTGNAAFRYLGPELPGTGLRLAAGTSETFEIEFAPSANQQFTDYLVVDERSFPLTGTGFDAPLPKPSLTIEGRTESGQQPRLTIRLESPATANMTGTLRMDFSGNDAAVRFVSAPAGGGNARSLSVQAREGESQLFLGGSSIRDAVFQTGTTAGEIIFTLEIGPHKETLPVRIQPAPAFVESGSALRRTQDIDVSLTGFDNTRSMSAALFSFYDASGRLLTPEPIRADIRRTFEQFFGTSDTGGVFTMRATFPVQGPAAQINAVEVELQNGAGNTRTQRLTILQ
jgi:hypothetical protein